MGLAARSSTRKSQLWRLLLTALAPLSLPIGAQHSQTQERVQVLALSHEASAKANQNPDVVEGTGALVYPNFLLRLRVVVPIGGAPEQIHLRLHRARTNETARLTAHKVGSGSSLGLSQTDTIYEVEWNITRRLGRWIICVDTRQSSNARPMPYCGSLVFQIDKRQQIVQLARWWANRRLASSNQSPAFNACDGFVAYIYRHLGLPEPTLNGSTGIADGGAGALHLFFSHVSGSRLAIAEASHISIDSGLRSIIDNNWGSSGVGPQEHFAVDVAQTYYLWASLSYSPADPNDPSESILDAF